MGEALIVSRGSGIIQSTNSKTLITNIFTSDTIFTVPYSINQQFSVRIFGGGGKGGVDSYGNERTISAGGGGGGGFMNNSILNINKGENISITIGKGATVNNSTGGTTSFGTYLSALGGDSGNNLNGGNGGSGGGGGWAQGKGGIGFQFGGGGSSSGYSSDLVIYGGNGGKWGGGGGSYINERKIYSVEGYACGGRLYENGYNNKPTGDSGLGGRGGTITYEVGTQSGTNTYCLYLENIISEFNTDIIGKGSNGNGSAGGGGGYGGCGGYGSDGGGGGGGYGANGGNGYNGSGGGGGGYGINGFGGDSVSATFEALDGSNARYDNIGVAGGGGAYGKGGSYPSQPTFGGGGYGGITITKRNVQNTRQNHVSIYPGGNGADGICIIQYYV